MRLHDAWHIRLEAEREAKIKSLEEEIARLRDALDEQTGRAAWHYECLIQRDAQVARLRLTDAERDAVEVAARFMDKWGGVPNTIASATLRGLLERLT